MLDLKQINSFLAAANCLSFTKAAENLYMTQSALSKQIATLERNLGMSLFVRSNNSLSLTPAGELLLLEGTRLVGLAKDVEYSMQDLRNGNTGRIKIAVQNAIVDAAPELFEKFRRTYPKVMLFARYFQSQTVPKHIINGDMDVGTMHSFELDFEKYGDELEIMKLYKERFYIMVSPNHPLAEKDSVTIEDLKGHRVIPLYDVRPPILAELFVREGGKDGGSTEYPVPISFDDLLLQVKLGLGFAAIVKPVAEDSYMGFKLLELEGEANTFDILMIWRKDNRSAVVDKFINMVRQCFPQWEMMS